MKSLLAIFIILEVSGIIWGIIQANRLHREHKREQAERLKVWEFWNAQCSKSLAMAREAVARQDWEAYGRARESFHVNMRRY